MVEKSIEELLAELGGMSYKAPSAYNGYQSSYKHVDRTLPDWTPATFKQSDFGSLKKGDKKDKKGINLWDVLSGTLGQPSGLTTTSAYKAAEKILDKDTPLWEKIFSGLNPLSVGLGEGIENGAKQQWKNWTDGDLSWGDVPGIGALHGADKGWKRGSDILQDFFKVDNKWGKVGGGIAIDIAADPLTYLTGGMSAATKLRKAAEVAEMTKQANKLGITGKFKTTAQFQEAAEVALRAKYAKYPNLVDKMVTKKLNEATQAIKTSANTAYNSNINKMGMGIPFTSKMVLGDMKPSNLLYRTEAKVGAPLVDDLLRQVSMNDDGLKATLEQVAKLRYGVDDLGSITKTQFDDLQKHLIPVIEKLNQVGNNPSVEVVSEIIETALPQADFERMMVSFIDQNIPWKDVQKQLDNFISVIGKDPKVRSTAGKMMAQKIADFWAKKADPSTTLYHGTSLRRFRDIAKSGKLTPQGSQGAGHFAFDRQQDYQGFNFLAGTADGAKGYTNDTFGGLENIPVVLKMKIPNHRLLPDDNDMLTAKSWRESLKKIDQVKVKGDIPLSHLMKIKIGYNGDEFNIHDWEEAYRIFKETGVNPTTKRVPKEFKQKVPNELNSKKAESMAWASKFLGDTASAKSVKNTVKATHKSDPKGAAMRHSRAVSKGVDDLKNNPYNEMMNGRTKFEHWLDSKNPFDTRTLNTSDKFVNSMGDHISDAHSQRVGETAQYGRALGNLQKFVNKNNVTKEQMEQAIYVIEKHAPDHLGGSAWKPSALVQKLADELRPIIDEIGKNEQAGGVLNSLRSNYFPHVINKSSDIIDEVDDFIKRNKEFNNLKGTNKFDQSRKGFQTLAQRDNYIKKIEKAIQKETNPDRIKTLQKQQEHVADIFDTDVVSALTRRVKEGTRAKAMKAMQGELSKFGMMKTITKGSKDAPPSGLTKLDPDVAKKMGLGEGTHYMHPEVLKGLERVDEIFTNQNMNKAARMISAFGDIWRPLVTYYKPAHYINNMIGNTFMNIAAGVRPKDVGSAIKLMTRYRSGKATDAELKLIKSAYKHNVISGGFLFDSRATFEFDVPTAIEKFAKVIGENKGISAVRKKGEIIDDWSRLANYINGLDKFGDSKKAAEQVRKYLFNYNELTNADRNMRVIVPFWNWTKRNLPLQMKLLMENPKFPLNVERFKNFWNDEEKGADWQKESGIKIPGTDYYTGLPSPTHDLNTLLNPKQFLSSTTPAIKMPLETSFNRKMYTGNPISYGSNDVQSEDMLDYIISNLGVGNNAYQAATGDKTALENIMGMLRPISKIPE